MLDFSAPQPHYAGKLRVRVCGICRRHNQVLLIRHQPLAGNPEGFWSPPGGGLLYGETMANGLKREFAEETGLLITVDRFLFIQEHLNIPLHAIEVLFAVTITGGVLQKGTDPELAPKEQLITEAAFKTLPEIQNLPLTQTHRIFHGLTSLDDLLQLPSLLP